MIVQMKWLNNMFKLNKELANLDAEALLADSNCLEKLTNIFTFYIIINLEQLCITSALQFCIYIRHATFILQTDSKF